MFYASRLLLLPAVFLAFATTAVADDVEGLEALERPAAEYPKKAFRKCVEGHVVVKFVVKTDGTTSQIEVVSSRPEGVFEKAAVEAVQKWRFKPRKLNGVAVNREAKQRLVFEPGCVR